MPFMVEVVSDHNQFSYLYNQVGVCKYLNYLGPSGHSMASYYVYVVNHPVIVLHNCNCSKNNVLIHTNFYKTYMYFGVFSIHVCIHMKM